MSGTAKKNWRIKMKYETYLPIFSGFYNTIWEPNSENLEYNLNQERKANGLYSSIDFNNLKIDYEEYEKDIVLNLCSLIQEELSKYIISIELENIYSPKEYNFANDSANIIIEVKENEIASFIYSHKSEFEKFLKNRYTSYDGFISHYENDFDSWEKDTKNFTDFSIDGHRLGSILDFIANIENIRENDLYEFVEVYIESYVNNYDELLVKQDGSLFELLTSNNISKNMAEYYSQCYENNSLKELCLSETILSIIHEYDKNFIIGY